jgi:hypothetical protein
VPTFVHRLVTWAAWSTVEGVRTRLTL